MMEIKKVDVECIDVFWDKVKNWVKACTIQSQGRHTLSSTYKLLKKGSMEMFLIVVNKAIAAVYVVQKTFYPAKVVLSILFCGGSKVMDKLILPGFGGKYKVNWDGKDILNSDVASGVYFYELRAESFINRKKMLLIR